MAIRRYQPGKSLRLSAAHLNELVDWINAFSIAGSPVVKVSRHGSSYALSLNYSELAARLPKIVSVIRFGKPTEAYTSGTSSIILDPCNAAGTDDGTANVTAPAGWTLPTGSTIATSAIVPFVQLDNGTFVVIGQPVNVVADIQVDDTNHKLQKKLVADFGLFKSTVSDWIDFYTNGQVCA